MIKYLLYFLLINCLSINSMLAQNVSINADGAIPDNSAMLDISDTTRGMLIPRLTIIQRNAVSNPATGLLIFQTDSDSGFYFNNGIPSTPNWTRLKTDGDSSFWSKKDSNLYFNTGNVGIGIDTAQDLLHLYGNGTLGAGARLVFGDDYHNKATKTINTFIGEFGWDSLVDSDRLQMHGKLGQVFTTGGGNGRQDLDTALVISGDGKVGVGTFSPRMEFHVNGSIIAESSTLIGLPTGLTYALLMNNNDESLLSSSSGFKSELLKINGSTIRFTTGTSNFSNPTVMFIDTLGFVGIGTDTPQNQLEIIDTGIVAIQVGADQTDQFLKLDYNTAAGFSSIQSGLFGGVSRPLIIQGGGGNVGIGTLNPEATLQVDGSVGQKISTLDIGTANDIDNLVIGSDEYLLRLTGTNSAANISGVDATFNGHMIVFFNASAFGITFQNNNGGSDAENRLLMHGGSDITLPASSSISFIYSSIDSRWIGMGYY